MSSRITHQETCWVRQGATLGCYACRKANAGHQHVFVRCIYAYVDNLRHVEGLKEYWQEMNAAHARGEVFTKQYVRPPPPLELTKEEIKEWKKRRAAERKETTTEKATAGLKRKKSKKESDSDDADSEVEVLPEEWDQDFIVTKPLLPTLKSDKSALQAKLAAAKEKLKKAQADKAQADKEKADKEKADKEQADKEQADKEQADKEKADKEKADKEKADKEQADKEQADKEQADKEQADKEKEQTDKGPSADKRVSFDLKTTTTIVAATVVRPRRLGAKYRNEANTAKESNKDAKKKSKLQTIGEQFRKRSGSTILNMSALKKRMNEAAQK